MGMTVDEHHRCYEARNNGYVDKAVIFQFLLGMRGMSVVLISVSIFHIKIFFSPRVYTAATVHILPFPLLDVVVEVEVGSLISVLRVSCSDEVDSAFVEMLVVGIVVQVVVGIVDEAVVEASAEVVGAKKIHE